MDTETSAGIGLPPQRPEYIGRDVMVWLYGRRMAPVPGVIHRLDANTPYATVIRLDEKTDGQVIYVARTGCHEEPEFVFTPAEHFTPPDGLPPADLSRLLPPQGPLLNQTVTVCPVRLMGQPADKLHDLALRRVRGTVVRHDTVGGLAIVHSDCDELLLLGTDCRLA